MKLLYGTGNPAKAAAMQNRIAGLGIELISLQDLRAQGVEIPDVPETGNTPLENARQKAHAYYEAFRMPVFVRRTYIYTPRRTTEAVFFFSRTPITSKYWQRERNILT